LFSIGTAQTPIEVKDYVLVSWVQLGFGLFQQKASMPLVGSYHAINHRWLSCTIHGCISEIP